MGAPAAQEDAELNYSHSSQAGGGQGLSPPPLSHVAKTEIQITLSISRKSEEKAQTQLPDPLQSCNATAEPVTWLRVRSSQAVGYPKGGSSPKPAINVGLRSLGESGCTQNSLSLPASLSTRQ